LRKRYKKPQRQNSFSTSIIKIWKRSHNIRFGNK
jgi:hypothetical protein